MILDVETFKNNKNRFVKNKSEQTCSSPDYFFGQISKITSYLNILH